MALSQTYTEVTLTFLDRENTKASTNFYLPGPGLESVNAAAIMTKADAITTAIAAMSDCVLLNQKVAFRQVDNQALGVGDAELKGHFVFAPSIGTPETVDVPAFKLALLSTDKRTIIVDPTNTAINADVLAFINAVLNGPVGFSNGGTNADGIDLVEAISGQGFKKHGRSLRERRGRSD